MTERDNILQELNELGSSLSKASFSNIYRVPGSYFNGLADQVIARIRAMEAQNSQDELKMLSPIIAAIGHKNPYQIPAKYFEDFEKNLMQIIFLNDAKHQTAQEELSTLSPLLSGLKKEMPFSVPNNYFETLATDKTGSAPKAKVISISSRTWFRYAAAAVVTGIIALGGFLFLGNKQQTTDPNDIVKESVKNISTETINSFITLTDAEKPMLAQASTKDDIKELVKNIPDEDIQNFLNDAQAAEPDATDDILN